MKKMLHATSWDEAEDRTDVTCYVKLCVCVDRVKILHVTSWDEAEVRTGV